LLSAVEQSGEEKVAHRRVNADSWFGVTQVCLETLFCSLALPLFLSPFFFTDVYLLLPSLTIHAWIFITRDSPVIMPFQQRPAESNPALEPLLPQKQPEPETSKEAPVAGNMREAELTVDVENLRETCSLINGKFGGREKPMANWTEDLAEVQILSESHESVESTAQNPSPNPPAPAAAPLKTPRLKELIKLFAEAIKEYDLVEDVVLGDRKDSSQDGSQSPDHHDRNQNTDKDIAKLWRNVKPMELETVSVDPEAQLEFHEQYSSVDDVYKLFMHKEYPINHASPFIEIHACLLRWRLSEFQKARLNFEEEFEDSYFDESIGPLIQGQIVMWDSLPITDL
jgi:hypothetical protein